MSVLYKREEIGNGIGLAVICDKKFKSNSVTVNFMTNLCKENAAANALIPNVLIASNSKYPERTMLTQKLASLYGASFGCSVSKQGDVQILSVKCNCIRDEYALEGEKLTEEVTQILLDCIFDPAVENGGFAVKEFNIRKNDQLDYISSMINEKRSYAIKRSNEVIFENEPFSVNAYGTKEQAEKLDAVSAYNAYQKLIKTAKIEITVAGGGRLDDAVKLVKDAFSKAERNFSDNLQFNTPSPVKPEVKTVNEPMDINQCKMVMAYKSDFDNLYVAKFMSAVLGGTAFSKLFTNVREKLSLCYYCASRIFEGKGTLVIDSGVDKKNVELAQKAINEQLEDMAKGDISDELIENTRLSIISEIRSSFDTLGSIASWYVVQHIRGTDYSPQQLIEIEKSITKEQIVECAKSFKLDTVYVLESKNGGEA